MGENVRKTADKMSRLERAEDTNELEKKAAEEKSAFEEKMIQLLLLARKKKNVLETQEVLVFFAGTVLDADRLDFIYDFLENSKVDVLSINADEDLELDPDLFIEE